MRIRKTRKEDINEIMKIIKMAQQSLFSYNVDQWQDGYPNKEVVMGDIRKQQSYAVEISGNMVGTAVISVEKEHAYNQIINGGWLTESQASYVVIHRIATHNDYKRRGIAGALLNYAEEVGREHKVRSIRMDTHPDNLIMQTWLKKNGFSFCGWIYLANGALRYAYEKVL